MRKNNKECTSKDCLKPSGLINWIGCDCFSSSVNISLSDSKKTQWFQCLLCVELKSVNKATIGNDLVLDNYIITAISNVRVLKRIPKDSRVPLAESLSEKKTNDMVYKVEEVTKWLIFLTSFLFFLEQPKGSGRKQTASMSSLINKKNRANDVSLPKPHPQVSSPPLSDLEQRIKLLSSKLDEGNVKGGIRLATLDDKIAPFSIDNYQKLLYSKSCYLFHENSVIMSDDGTQQGDSEAPLIFAETIQTLVKQLESKINISDLDDGSLADDYKVVLRDLKNIPKSEQLYGLSLDTGKCELCFFWDRLRVHSIIQL